MSNKDKPDRVALAEVTPAPTATSCGPRTFPHRARNGNEPSYTCEVPATTYYIYMEAGGGAGGYGTDDDLHSSGGPGAGARVAGLIPVVPGETLAIYVGQGAQHDWHAMDGYAPGGQGGSGHDSTAAHGGAGGGSTAVKGSKSGVLIHAGGGGGAGGRGALANGGNGGDAGPEPKSGTKGGHNPLGPGGRGGAGGDPKLTTQGGNGGSSSAGGGGGGGGGGGWHCGDGGGSGDNLGGGGGGGGGGSTFIVGSAIGIRELPSQHTQVGYVTFKSDGSVLSTVGSAFFANVSLRLDASGVSPQSPVGGIVNCQFGADDLERLNVHVRPNGNLAFESAHTPGVYLRMDGSGVTHPVEPGGGVVNCQWGPGELTEFRVVLLGTGTAAIESVKFPGVFLRMDGRGVKQKLPSGGGIVNCQFGAKGWETFSLIAPA